MTRVFVGGEEEPDDVEAVTDTFRCNWTRTSEGWYPSDGGFHRRAESWWWLTMHRGPLEERGR